jgi:hypothetical protein
MIRFTLSPNALLISGTTKQLVRQMVPLLGWNVTETRAFVPMAVRDEGAGAVVYRPREFQAGEVAGQQLEQNLRNWSFQEAREVPEEKMSPDSEAAPAGQQKTSPDEEAAPTGPQKTPPEK